MLTLKPKGRGNWRTSTLHIEGAHQLPMLVVLKRSLTKGFFHVALPMNDI